MALPIKPALANIRVVTRSNVVSNDDLFTFRNDPLESQLRAEVKR